MQENTIKKNWMKFIYLFISEFVKRQQKIKNFNSTDL